MAKKQNGLNKKAFVEAVYALSEEKGLSEDKLKEIIGNSFQFAYNKKLEEEFKLNPYKATKLKGKDDIKLEGALVRCEINLKKGEIELFHQFKVLNDDDIQDDFVEISVDDERVVEQGLKVGDFYEEPIDFNSFSQGDIMRFVSNYKQELSKAEKEILLETFADKIGKIVTGTVEKADPHSVLVNLGRTSAPLYDKDLIGKETYKVGDSIKVLIASIGKDSSDKKGTGSLIKITRSSEEFLKQLFYNEIHEIYDGTVVIKDVARFAGIRSKVVVYSEDPNVDPSGACIGQNGNRIQAIVSQLGNNRENKENVDIVTYRHTLGMYLAECLTPKTDLIKGIYIDDEQKNAWIIATDEQAKLTLIGKGGCNSKLTRKLFNFDKINILLEDDDAAQGIAYKDIATLEEEEREAERRKIRDEAIKRATEKALHEASLEETKPVIDEPLYKDDEDIEYDDEYIENIENIEENQPDEVKVEEVKEEPTKAETTKVDVEQREVHTTISLKDLEASLEKEKKEKPQESNKKKSSKKEDKKAENKEDKKEFKKMDIYTQEELEDFDEEELEEYEDEDFSEYDDDSYYEDN